MNKPVITSVDIKVIDKSGTYDVAMRSLGFNFTQNDLERILNMVKIVELHGGNTTIADTLIVNKQVPKITKAFNNVKKSSA